MSALPGTGHPPPSSSKQDFLIVGLGGSAGAIPPFREFFRNVPADSNMAYVVILHLSPNYESRLAEVLQATATIPVAQVSEATKVEPNQVYVIPPNKSLTMRGDMLTVSDIQGYEERRAPVDIFFRTLADTHDSRAVCVVLSGTGADGSMGLRRIKEYNGLVLVQDPDEAEFAEMPRNSIATGLVDFVVPVAEMPRRIIDYRHKIEQKPLDADDEREGNEQALMQIFTHLRLRTGHDFTNYKRATVLRCIERRLVVRGVATLPEYAHFMRGKADEADALLRELLISVTNFFRDKEVWERVEETIVPRLVPGKGADDPVRVWVPGCATGEEAYSIAMLLADAAASMPQAPAIQIFGTDADEEAISRARNGFYSVAETADVPPDRLRRYFIEDVGGYRVRRELRELVLFAHHNLIKDPPFSHLDFVSCRNVLIYLNRTAQARATEVLHFALEPGGYLLLGTAETVDGTQLFSLADKENHIYQSRAVPRVVPMPAPLPPAVSELRAGTSPPELRSEARARFGPLDLHQRLLEEYAPPSLIVDEHYAIVHLSEGAGRYLRFSVGEASINLLQVVRPELRIDLRNALFQAAQQRKTVVARGVAVHTGQRLETLNVIVRPALREGDPGRGFFLVLFEEPREAAVMASPHDVTATEPAARQLEEELIRLKTQMRVTIEQYEIQGEEARAGNEELQAMNEELRSTAEELETSQEELQSVNEELQTVNQELKTKVDEISHANDDMRNLMSSTEIGTIFVDRALRVKLFTPRARDVFNLIPGDAGRPLLDITSKLSLGDLGADLERVLDRLQTIEREVEGGDGHCHLMRLLPYRTAEDRIDGVVVTFLDITTRKQAEEALRRAHEELEQRVTERTADLRKATAMLQAIVDQSPLAIIAVDAGRNVMIWNASAELMFGLPADAVIGKPLPEAAPGAHGAQRTVMDDMFAGKPPRMYEAVVHRSDGTERSVNIFPAPLRASDGTVYAVMGLLQDITERKPLAQERDRLLRRIVSTQEQERQRIARELHDQLGQHLTALKVGLEALPLPGEHVQRMRTLVGDLDRSVDRLTIELRPPALDELGLHGAIGSLLEQFGSASGIRADIHATGTDGQRLPDVVETTLYRVLQEALNNVWKHSGAKSVSVVLELEAGQVQMIVEDDGKGFEESETADAGARGRFGLLGMRERISLIGGTCSIESAPDRGTTLYCRVPLALAGFGA